jgi:hypothetical protein
VICPQCPGRSAAGGVPQATTVTALTCCYAPRGRRWECEVAGIRWSENVDRPCWSQGLSWSSSHRHRSRAVAWSAHRWPSGWHCEQVWAWVCVRTGGMAPGHVVPLSVNGTTGTAGTARHRGHSGTAAMAARVCQRLRTRRLRGRDNALWDRRSQGDWIGDEVLYTNRLRQARPFSGPMFISLPQMA